MSTAIHELIIFLELIIIGNIIQDLVTQIHFALHRLIRSNGSLIQKQQCIITLSSPSQTVIICRGQVIRSSTKVVVSLQLIVDFIKFPHQLTLLRILSIHFMVTETLCESS